MDLFDVAVKQPQGTKTGARRSLSPPQSTPAMKLFTCPTCQSRLYFENAQCLACGTHVGYVPERADFIALPAADRFACANAAQCGCNWTVEEDGALCAACRLNRTIPDLSVEGNQARWTKIEAAKRRAIYALIAFGLDISPKEKPEDEAGLAFDFLADTPAEGERVLTGHDSGLITLNVAEADSPEREKMRVAMGERYRTLLGHFRHELGHYYWERLVRDDRRWLDRFRAVFGDERDDYADALKRHYEQGPPADWAERHISAYAASHPWEDFAESWAHYLHIADTLEMVAALNFPLGRLDAVGAEELPPNEGEFADRPGAEHEIPAPATGQAFDDLLKRWLVLCEAANQINRCMGLPDLYPFVIAEETAEKLRFVHERLAEPQVPA